MSDPLSRSLTRWRLAFWLMLGVTVALWFVLLIDILGTSVMAELGHRAVTGIERDITYCLNVEWPSELCEDLITTWHVDAGVTP